MSRKISSTLLAISAGIVFLSILTGWIEKEPLIKTAEVQQSAARSVLILQKSGHTFINKAFRQCASCHHTTLTSMVAAKAKQKGVSLIDSLTVQRVQSEENTVRFTCNDNMINQFIAAKFIAPYELLGLYAEKYPANFYTDIAVNYLLNQAKADGSFDTETFRVPLETGEIHLTAMSIRAIRVYASPARRKQVSELVARTRQWIEFNRPDTHQELAFQLLGMQWCGSSYDKKMEVTEKLKSIQNADGGWSQLPTMKSDAYATGQSLYALFESGMMKPEDEVYQKGLHFLLKTQDESGAWIVGTRSFAIQPFINSDFPPYDENQFISAAATNWAALALLNALPDKKE